MTVSRLLDQPLFAPVLGAARAARGMATRLLHPLRRRRTLRRIRGLPSPVRIMMVCTGNICRSPYAEARGRELSGSQRGVEIRSAGWMGPAGRLSPGDARAAAEARGLDLAEHTSEVLTDASIAWADLILVMERAQARILRDRFGADEGKILLLGDLDPLPPDLRDIPDPLDLPRAFYDEVFDRMDRCTEELWRALDSSR